MTKVKKTPNFLFLSGLIIFLLGILLFFLTFYRILWQEVKYSVSTGFRSSKAKIIKPINEDFGIVIPKIQANAKVIENVDPYDSKVYQWALTKGVAHAKSTAYPGYAGNSFIFAHSSTDWYMANRYNSVFYLLDKLDKGDKIEMYYKKNKYVYKVKEKKLVNPEEISYLNPIDNLNTATLTLMTCWPPGTTIKRLIIIAEISK